MIHDSAWLGAGTRVMTLRGEIAVESVHVGDRVVTLSGEGSTLKPVVAVRSREIDLGAHPQPRLAAPVRVRAGAVAAGMPIRDLLMAPGCALGLEDDDAARVLVPAQALANGASIRREPETGRVTYWQVALAAHDLLMADGMAVESAVASQVVALRPPAAEAAPDLTGRGESEPCAPVLARAPALHARLLAMALADGYRLTDDPALELDIEGAAAVPLRADAGGFVILLPAGATLMRLRSRSVIPAELDPAGGDTRRLGVAVARVVRNGVELALDGPWFGAGFLAMERDGGAAWRWTDGDAAMVLPALAEESLLEAELHAGWSKYWDFMPPSANHDGS